MPGRKKQIGALPWRKKKGRIQVLLVTSRETKRWVIPKGWPEAHLMDFNAARQEAFEEAGVAGHMHKMPVGHYEYDKRLDDGSLLPCRVFVYSLEVTEKFDKWPERRQRKREWFELDDAAAQVDETGLKEIIGRLG
jgi:8-oxo-dGTP pyrophosphatase MutT (NUDIX family)